jgi:hypothetical protein
MTLPGHNSADFGELKGNISVISLPLVKIFRVRISWPSGKSSIQKPEFENFVRPSLLGGRYSRRSGISAPLPKTIIFRWDISLNTENILMDHYCKTFSE